MKKSLKDINSIALIGIGGSSLGAKAVYHFLKPAKKIKRELIFFESTDPVNINNKIKILDLKKTLFIIVSKSGTTIETISIYKYILSLCNDINRVFITDKNSKLDRYANSINAKIFYIPNSVGGRFSVLSPCRIIASITCWS